MQFLSLFPPRGKARQVKGKHGLAWQVVLHVGFVRVALLMTSARGSRFRNVSLPGSWINHVLRVVFRVHGL